MSNTCSVNILLMIKLRSSRSLAMDNQKVRVLIRAIEHIRCLHETLNSLHRQPLQVDMNMRCKPISHPPRPVFICRLGFISRQSALIAWHNALNYTIKARPTVNAFPMPD